MNKQIQDELERSLPLAISQTQKYDKAGNELTLFDYLTDIIITFGDLARSSGDQMNGLKIEKIMSAIEQGEFD